MSLSDIGVQKAMIERWGPDFHKKCLVCGGSAGTIFALVMALGKDPEYMEKLYETVSVKTVTYGPIFFGAYFLEQELRKLLDEDPFAYKKLEGRCCFGTTEFFSKHRWHVSWESNEDLMKCIKASLHIPLYCGICPGIKGVECVDGAYGFAGTDLPHGDETLYIGIDPHAEVTRTFTHNEMFYPTVGKEYQAMIQSGYDQFKAWNGKMNKKVGSRTPNYQALYVLWTLKILENIFLGMFTSVYSFLVLVITILSFLMTAIGLRFEV